MTEGKHVKRRGGINSRVVCITESQVLEELKVKKEKKKLDEQLKAERKMERERKKLEKEEKKKEKARQRIEKKKPRQAQKKGTATAPTLESGMSELTLNDTESELDASEDEAICPKCGTSSLESNDLWVACDGGCEKWFDFKCTGIKSIKQIPELFICENCL